jgi:4-amino-4-deoxy-L-arabinose transferase-like glycosyltransferase
MRCPACGHEPPASAAYCGSCGCVVEGRRHLFTRLPAIAPRVWFFFAIFLAAAAQWLLSETHPSVDVPWAPAGVLVAAIALAAVTVAGRPDAWPSLGLEFPEGFRLARPTWPLAGALLLEGLLVLRLLRGSDAESDLWLWAAALIAGLLAFVRPATQQRERDGVPWWRRASGPELLFVGGLVLGFAGIASHDLEHWRYSVIGDEYVFYQWALDAAEHGLRAPFSHEGVYSTHPVLNTGFQASVMRLTGEDNLGWRMASVVALAVTIPAVYIVATRLAGRTAGVAAAVVFASSHYLLAYAHTGYNNAHALAPAAWAMALFILGMRKGSSLLLYLAGVSAGLGFYTFFSARAAIVILALVVLLSRDFARRTALSWPLALGFCLAVLPLFAASGLEAITVMFDEAAGGYDESVSGPPLERVGWNLSTNLLAFNVNDHQMHFVGGSLLDAVSAVAAVIGIGVAVGLARKRGAALLLLWLAVGFVATGLLSPYPHTAVSRLSFLVAPLAVAAGLAAAAVVNEMREAAIHRGMTWAALAVLGMAVVALNAYHFWWETPRTYHLSQETVAVGASQSALCDGRISTIVSPAAGAALRVALESYGWRDVRAVTQSTLAQVKPEDVLVPGCVIFTDPSSPEAGSALSWLHEQYPAGSTANFSDQAEKGIVLIFVTGS